MNEDAVWFGISPNFAWVLAQHFRVVLFYCNLAWVHFLASIFLCLLVKKHVLVCKCTGCVNHYLPLLCGMWWTSEATARSIFFVHFHPFQRQCVECVSGSCRGRYFEHRPPRSKGNWDMDAEASERPRSRAWQDTCWGVFCPSLFPDSLWQRLMP